MFGWFAFSFATFSAFKLLSDTEFEGSAVSTFYEQPNKSIANPNITTLNSIFINSLDSHILF